VSDRRRREALIALLRANLETGAVRSAARARRRRRRAARDARDRLDLGDQP
jgi:hypothetical protein